MPYTIDPAHSSFEFSVKHMVIASTKGRFATFDATANIDDANLPESSATISIDAASIDTRDATRDNHLRSADFFDVEKFPKITFQSKKVEAKGKGDYRIVGDLNIHGVSKEVALDAEVSGPVKDPWGNTRMGVSAQTKINRKDWGLNWNSVLEAGGLLVGDDVRLTAELEFVKSA